MIFAIEFSHKMDSVIQNGVPSRYYLMTNLPVALIPLSLSVRITM